MTSTRGCIPRSPKPRTTPISPPYGYDRPMIFSEYAHAHGPGRRATLQDYWDIIEHPDNDISSVAASGTGVDQSVYRPSDLLRGVRTKNGFYNWVAGYDYNSTEFVGDGFQGNFLNNGIITPDRAWTAKLTEVKAVYAPAAFSDWDAATRSFTLRNKLAFSDLVRPLRPFLSASA